MKKLFFAVSLVFFAAMVFLFSSNQKANAAVACAQGCNGAYGHAYNHTTIHAARQRALQMCHKYCNNCRIFHQNASRGWGALARNESTGRIGVGTGFNNRRAAEQRALQDCGGGCRIKKIWNDTVGTR